MTHSDATAGSAPVDRSGLLATVVFLWFGGLVTFLVMRSGPPRIEMSPEAITISGSSYGSTVRFSDIDSVTFRRNLDGIEGRINAMQNGNDYRGSFAMRPYGRARLFVDAAVRPFIVLHARNGVTIFSAADSGTAIRLASDLRQRALEARRSRSLVE